MHSSSSNVFLPLKGLGVFEVWHFSKSYIFFEQLLVLSCLLMIFCLKKNVIFVKLQSWVMIEFSRRYSPLYESSTNCFLTMLLCYFLFLMFRFQDLIDSNLISTFSQYGFEVSQYHLSLKIS